MSRLVNKGSRLSRVHMTGVGISEAGVEALLKMLVVLQS